MNRFNRFFLFALAGLFALSLANCSSDGSAYTPPTTQGTLAIDNTFHRYTIKEAQWYEFSATSGKPYRIAWDDSHEGSGTYTADVKVSANYADGTSIFEDKDSGYNSPQFFTSASSGTIYVKIEPYYNKPRGTVGVKVSSP